MNWFFQKQEDPPLSPDSIYKRQPIAALMEYTMKGGELICGQK